jgi:hypothetical protein
MIIMKYYIKCQNPSNNTVITPYINFKNISSILKVHVCIIHLKTKMRIAKSNQKLYMERQ